MLDTNTLWLWHSEVIALDMKRVEVSRCPREALGTILLPELSPDLSAWGTEFLAYPVSIITKEKHVKGIFVCLSIYCLFCYCYYYGYMEHSLSSSNCIFWLSSFFSSKYWLKVFLECICLYSSILPVSCFHGFYISHIILYSASNSITLLVHNHVLIAIHCSLVAYFKM